MGGSRPSPLMQCSPVARLRGASPAFARVLCSCDYNKVDGVTGIKRSKGHFLTQDTQ
ncbi:unnamed protein product, partial [Ectocarpus sp. 13 AM-2016]